MAEGVSLLELLGLEIAVDRREYGDEPCSRTARRDGQHDRGHESGDALLPLPVPEVADADQEEIQE